VYHCGARIQNTHRPMAAQREDWKRLRPLLKHRRLTPRWSRRRGS
jgi:hypothetical protein